MSFKSHLVTRWNVWMHLEKDWKFRWIALINFNMHTIIVRQTLLIKCNNKYHLKIVLFNNWNSDQSNRKAVTFGLYLPSDSFNFWCVHWQMRIIQMGARLFARICSINQPTSQSTDRPTDRMRSSGSKSFHYIPFHFSCNGKFVVDGVAFEMKKKMCWKNWNGIKWYLQFALNSHFADRNIYKAVITLRFFFVQKKISTSSLFFERVMHKVFFFLFFYWVCKMKSQFWHSFK